MKKRIGVLAGAGVGMGLCFALLRPPVAGAADTPQPVSTNKDKLLTLAVQGEIAPAEPARSYGVTWEGKPKMMIGVGGINYNLRIGDNVFDRANGDRATVGVSTVGVGEGGFGDAWLTMTSIGNEVKVMDGEAKGEKGVVIGKFDNYVLVHFDEAVLPKLAVGDKLQAKAVGVGLAINGFDDIHAHGITPELVEKIAARSADAAVQVQVVKEIPAEIVGQGAGRSSLSGAYHIQTCYPPDIQEYGLDTLRFGDLVLLKDIQTDYGKGYYQGGATLGVVCTGPSDISGLGIGVTPILSTRTGKLTARIDPHANVAELLGIPMKSSASATGGAPGGEDHGDGHNGTADVPTTLKTNKDKLIETAVEGVVQPIRIGGYSTTYDGKPKITLGMASINYTVSYGDPAYGWASADHVEPDVTIQGRDQPRPSDCALAILACIGNEAKVLSGDAKGAKGIYIGRHAGSDDLVWFPKDVVDKLGVEDEIQVRAKGVGLKISGFEDVRVNKISPEALERMGITIEDGQLVVPVALEVPGHVMGSGMGGAFLEPVDYDVQTTDPKTIEELGLKKLRLGDLVAIRDHYDVWGRGRYEGAVTIGVCIHGWSDLAGHGPGLNPILSAMPGKIKTKLDPHANMAYYLGIKQKPAGSAGSAR